MSCHTALSNPHGLTREDFPDHITRNNMYSSSDRDLKIVTTLQRLWWRTKDLKLKNPGLTCCSCRWLKWRVALFPAVKCSVWFSWLLNRVRCLRLNRLVSWLLMLVKSRWLKRRWPATMNTDQPWLFREHKSNIHSNLETLFSCLPQELLGRTTFALFSLSCRVTRFVVGCYLLFTDVCAHETRPELRQVTAREQIPVTGDRKERLDIEKETYRTQNTCVVRYRQTYM